jgi:hypothetical protein
MDIVRAGRDLFVYALAVSLAVAIILFGRHILDTIM